MKRTGIIFTLFFLISCSNYKLSAVQPSREFEFTRDFVESLRHVKNSAEKRQAVKAPDPEYEYDDTEKITAFMINLNSANADIKTAESLIDKYQNSDNEYIQKVGRFVFSAYNKQIQLGEKLLKLYETVYDPQKMAEMDLYTQGQLLQDIEKLNDERRNIQKLLLDTPILVTHVLISEVPSRDGTLNFFTITSAERKELINKIDEIFGEVVKTEVDPEQNYIEACAATIRGFLTSGYKSSDER